MHRPRRRPSSLMPVALIADGLYIGSGALIIIVLVLLLILFLR
jgi:hypothetical protein